MNNDETVNQLVLQALNGDSAAFEELFNMTNRQAYFVAYSISQNEEIAKDILQDSYLKAFTSLKTLNNADSFVPWFKRIVANTSKNYMTRKTTDSFDEMEESGDELPFEETDITFIPDQSLDKEETSRMMMKILSQLSEDQRLCVMAYYYDEMSIAEIASALEITENTVKMRLYHARSFIKTEVQKIEKNGVKLYGAGVAAIPLMAWLLKNMATMQVTNSAAILGNVMASVNGAAIAAGAHAGISASSVATQTTATAVSTATKTGLAAKIAGMSLAQKIIAGIVVAVIIATPVAGSVWMHRNTKLVDIQTVTNKSNYAASKNKTDEKEIKNTYGNTSGNIHNDGHAAQQGDWIYYENASDNSFLYKIKSDGTNKTKLNDVKSSKINVVGDWIYYKSGSDYSLYKIRTDGTQVTKIYNGDCYWINVVDDWIYFQNGGNICKIRTDGTGEIKLNSDNSNGITVLDDWIYYSNGSDNFYIYKIRTDGTSKTKIISNGAVANLIVVGDWIYYSNLGSLFKVRTDGTGNIKLLDYLGTYFNVSGDWIYFSQVNPYSEDTTTYLEKIRTDGTGKVKLNCKDINQINVVSDWVYYENYTREVWGDIKETFMYKVRTDGTEKQLVN